MNSQQDTNGPMNHANADELKQTRSVEDVILIAVMGATGTGKSTFINLASGMNLAVGDDLMSCTSEVTYSHEFILDGRRVILMDTPGFDDTTVSDTDILRMISLHLHTTYEHGVILSGILYLHRISDPRMGGITRRNFTMFRKLCGDETLNNVLIITTMWGLVDPERGAARERQLRSDGILFKPVLESGARMIRHDNTPKCAQDILRMIMKNRPQVLRIQRELVDEQKDISQTGAGAELGREFAELAKKHREELEAIRAELEAAHRADTQTRKELEECRKQLQTEMEKAKTAHEHLSQMYAQEKKQTNERLELLRQELDAEKAAGVDRQKELRQLQAQLVRNTPPPAESPEQLLVRHLRALHDQRRSRGGFCSIQ